VQAARSVTGVDVSPAAVAAARTREGGESVRFEVIDGLGLPFPDHSFDLVTSWRSARSTAEVASAEVSTGQSASGSS
jgi:ubiquinone/menaquinone biosynthesis C-methylase UbiE